MQELNIDIQSKWFRRLFQREFVVSVLRYAGNQFLFTDPGSSGNGILQTNVDTIGRSLELKKKTTI